MRYEVSADIAAAAERVWSVLVDVERMPMWTSSMTRVERLDGGPFGMGSRVRIKQPRLPVAVWRVCELTPLSSFSWATTSHERGRHHLRRTHLGGWRQGRARDLHR